MTQQIALAGNPNSGKTTTFNMLTEPTNMLETGQGDCGTQRGVERKIRHSLFKICRDLLSFSLYA